MTTLIIGNKYKYFLINKFKFEGELISKDTTFITIFDDMQQQEIIIPIGAIVNIEVL